MCLVFGLHILGLFFATLIGYNSINFIQVHLSPFLCSFFQATALFVATSLAASSIFHFVFLLYFFSF